MRQSIESRHLHQHWCHIYDRQARRVNGTLSGDARWTKESKRNPNQVIVAPSSAKRDVGKHNVDRNGSKVARDAATVPIKLVCLGDWRCDVCAGS